ncbi:hypothetical protein TNIN_373021 [Trichonephila inaurata madagascariensis]|uniref:Uncharacterized protein n=1 Tax=Trichonephila inaurata madagascariensis TaxID=2747483 RepID=A0A8X6YD27_9ARAC|nr:hypothetical protein TNIN_373021 [Trichonephila inaurata madagascariensis]
MEIRWQTIKRKWLRLITKCAECSLCALFPFPPSNKQTEGEKNPTKSSQSGQKQQPPSNQFPSDRENPFHPQQRRDAEELPSLRERKAKKKREKENTKGERGPAVHQMAF